MKAYSILFDSLDSAVDVKDRFSPEVMKDIQIEAVIERMLKGREDYELEPYFVHKLPDAQAIQYRLDMMKEIDQAELLRPLHTFSQQMKNVREITERAETSHDKEQRWKWHLDAAFYYCHAVLQLHEVLTEANPQSLGLSRFADWLLSYVESAPFQELRQDAFALREAFDEIRYSMIVENGKMTIQPAAEEENFCKELEAVFGSSELEPAHADYSFSLFPGTQFTGVELSILNVVKKLYPEPFRQLKSFASKHKEIMNESVITFAREVQFYIATLEFYHSLSIRGLPYCYAVISEQKQIRITSGYDVALATSDLHKDEPIVQNDLHLQEDERICVVTGPNQGGKTTYARFIGQILYLSAIGCPVPCEAAQVYAFDHLLTHFPAKEQVGRDTGQLKEELLRLKQLFALSTPDSVVILNELFATTATLDAYAMGRNTLQTFADKGALCFYVTHIFELAESFPGIISLAATTDAEQPGKRTFKIVRKRADGQVYASTLVEKYGLSKAQMEERIK